MEETDTSPVDISIVVPTYNRDAVLIGTLKGLLAQDPMPREILVVDQSPSHDPPTTAFLKQLQDNLRIRYFHQSEPNAQKARNLGIREARGSIILFVDDDVVMGEKFVEAHWRNYRADTDLAAVCGFYLEPGEQPLDEMPLEYRRPTTGWIYMPHCYSKRIECWLLPTCNGSVKRSIALKLGGFDENYTHTLLDDTDFACRLKKLGIKSVHDPEARLFHLKEKSGGKRPGGIDEYVVADSNKWYTWFYFFGINFGWKSWRELTSRWRRYVLHRRNLAHPYSLLSANAHCFVGLIRALVALKHGRRLGLTLNDPPAIPNSHQSELA